MGEGRPDQSGEFPVSRSQMAAILHEIANSFSLPVDLEGNFLINENR